MSDTVIEGNASGTACRWVAWAAGVLAGGYLGRVLLTDFDLVPWLAVLYGVVAALLAGLALKKALCRTRGSRVQQRIAEAARRKAAEEADRVAPPSAKAPETIVSNKETKRPPRPAARTEAAGSGAKAQPAAAKGGSLPADPAAAARALDAKLDEVAPAAPAAAEKTGPGAAAEAPAGGVATGGKPASAATGGEDARRVEKAPAGPMKKAPEGADAGDSPVPVARAESRPDRNNSKEKTAEGSEGGTPEGVVVVLPAPDARGAVGKTPSAEPRQGGGPAVAEGAPEAAGGTAEAGSEAAAAAAEGKAPASRAAAAAAPAGVVPMKPRGMDAPDGAPDDLTRLTGLTDAHQKALNAVGIWHLSQFAAMNRRELAWINLHIAADADMSAEDWRRQAIAETRKTEARTKKD